MKTTCALLLLAALLPTRLFAGDEIAKQRAKELVNQNNVRQGVAPPTAAAAPQAPGAAVRQNPALAKLRTDLAALKPNATVTQAQKDQLALDLLAVASGPNKPTVASANKWAEDVAAACAEMALTDANRGRFVTELDAVLNPTKYPQAKPEAIFADVQAIFQVDGTARRNAVKVSEDVKTLAGESRAK